MKYISAPYSNATDKDERMSMVSTYSANCLKRNEFVICPLTMGHNFIKTGVQLPFDSNWWLGWCFAILSKCTQMDVLMIPGWEESTGVMAEIRFAQGNNIPINYVQYENIYRP